MPIRIVGLRDRRISIDLQVKSRAEADLLMAYVKEAGFANVEISRTYGAIVFATDDWQVRVRAKEGKKASAILVHLTSRSDVVLDERILRKKKRVDQKPK